MPAKLLLVIRLKPPPLLLKLFIIYNMLDLSMLGSYFMTLPVRKHGFKATSQEKIIYKMGVVFKYRKPKVAIIRI